MRVPASVVNKYVIKYLRNEWKLFALLMISLTIGRGIDIILPLFYKKLVDSLTAHAPYSTLIHGVVIIFIINLAGWIGRRIYDLSVNNLEPRIMKRMTDESHEYVLKHSYDFFVNNFAGSIIKKLSRYTNGFDKIFYNYTHTLYPLLLTLSGTLILTLSVKPIFSVIIFIWVSIFFIVNYLLSKHKMKYDSVLNDIDSKVGGTVADNITNSFNIALFSAEDREQKKLEENTTEWRRITTSSWNVFSWVNAFLAILMIGLEFIVLSVALGFYTRGQMTVGDFVLLQGLLTQIFSQLWSVGKIFRDLSKGYADMGDVIEMLERPHEVKDVEGACPLVIAKGEILIHDLSFNYADDKRVIYKDFSLRIDAGKKVALVSKSGGGKTTLVKLLLRLYNIPENTIFIDGQDISRVTLESLRKSISLVPQDPILFHRSIKDNIAYGRPEATMGEIIEAAKKARCHEFISELKDGYDTLVGERGVKLSGGERQRIAIARAILEDAPILILDEATSALDSESEMLIKEALQELMQNKTTIAIAHRLSTIIQMDEIIVIEKGKIRERGSHKTLLEMLGSQYKKLWDIQAGGFSEVSQQVEQVH